MLAMRVSLRVWIVGIGAAVAIVHHPPLLEAVNQVDQIRIFLRLADKGRFQQLFGCRPLWKNVNRPVKKKTSFVVVWQLGNVRFRDLCWDRPRQTLWIVWNSCPSVEAGYSWGWGKGRAWDAGPNWAAPLWPARWPWCPATICPPSVIAT